MPEICGVTTDQIQVTRLSKTLVISSNRAVNFPKTPRAARHHGTSEQTALVTTANKLKLT